MSPLFIKIDVMCYILILREKMMLFPTLLVMMLINGDIYVIVKDLDYSYVVVEMWNVTFFFLNDILRKWEEKEDRKFEAEAFRTTSMGDQKLYRRGQSRNWRGILNKGNILLCFIF